MIPLGTTPTLVPPQPAPRRILITTSAVASIVLVLVAASLVLLRSGPAQAATPITVASAISSNSGSATVRGYIVGQPTATNTVVTSSFPNDYALAIADSANQTSTSSMLYVKIPSSFRSAWGLKSNPSLVGTRIDVTGTLGAYFSHAGLTTPTAFALASTTSTPTATATPTATPTATATAGPYDSTYYASAVGKSGSALRNALHEIIDDHTTISYSAVWSALKVTDADPNNANNVIEFYSGTSISKNSNGGDVGDWNREHTWPQSHGNFGTSAGPGTDLHHLRPEDVTVNSTRGNKDFDTDGSAVTNCSGCLSDSNSFAPRASVRGDLARMIFYMAIRYEGDDGFADLEINNTTNGSVAYLGKLSVLKAWNLADPPDAREKWRNDIIYTNYQHNRNPFIDHPEWVTAIWGS